MKKLKHGAGYAGIMGFGLAAERAGFENAWTIEINDFCNKVIAKNFPDATRFNDIRECGKLPYVDVFSAGFPCQPFSLAGLGLGVEDDRYHWPQTKRIIKINQPGWVILENVAGLFTILEPDSISEVEKQEVQLFCEDNTYETTHSIERVQRRVIGRIIEEIRAEGYILPELEDGTPVVLCIPACGVGAPHRRDRVWIIAHSARINGGRTNSNRKKQNKTLGADFFKQIAGFSGFGFAPDPMCISGQLPASGGFPGQQKSGSISEEGIIANSDRERFSKPYFSAITGEPQEPYRQNNAGRIITDTNRKYGNLPGYGTGELQQQQPGTLQRSNGFRLTESPVCSPNDGLSSGLVRNITKQLEAYGNAIVPDIAELFFHLIAAIEKKILV